MSFAIALSDGQWELVADLFDPPGQRGAPAVIPRRQMVDAMLSIGRTGGQWRYMPERYGAWTAVWAQWRRWCANGVWATAMTRLPLLLASRRARFAVDVRPHWPLRHTALTALQGRAHDRPARALAAAVALLSG